MFSKYISRISVVLFIAVLVSCSSWKNNGNAHKTSYQINEFELPLVTKNAGESAQKLIAISEELGFREMTPENFRTPENLPLLRVAPEGYLLEFKEDDLVYFLDIDTMNRESLIIRFEKEKYFSKKISDSDFRNISKQMFSRIKEKYQME